MTKFCAEFALVGETDKYKHYKRLVPLRRQPEPFSSEARRMKNTTHDDEDIFVFSDMLGVTESSRREKVHKSGKSGVYFERLRDEIFSARQRTCEGEPMFRVLSRKYGDFTPVHRHNPNDAFAVEIAHHVSELVERAYGLVVGSEWKDSALFYQLISYPMFRAWSLPHLAAGSAAHVALHKDGMDSFDPSMKVLSRGFLRSTPRAFVQQSFGKRFVRKDFIKQVAATEMIGRLASLSRYSKYFSSDLGLSYLRLEGTPVLEYLLSRNIHSKTLNNMLAPLTPAVCRRVLISVISPANAHYDIQDFFRVLDDISRNGVYDHGLIDFRNWKTMHDTITLISRDQWAARQETAVRRDELSLITQKNHYKILDGVSMELDGSEYSLVSAKNVAELRSWGNEMSNCIGSYRAAALTHDSYLFGVYNNDALLANMEINPAGEIVQLVGKYNLELPKPIESVIANRVRELIPTS